ncbi:MAG: hypothetical protein Q9209_002283 [Squamulea sp. 1 TL-2023]
MRLSFYWPFSNITTVILAYLYCLPAHQFLAHAADTDTVIYEDHNHHRLLNFFGQPDALRGGQVKETNYEPDFAGLDRGIIGRAQEEIKPLANNAPQPRSIEPDDIQYWTFSKSNQQGPYGKFASDLPLNLTASTKRTCLEDDLNSLVENQTTTSSTGQVWLSISVCDQPTPTTAGAVDILSQLEVYVSLDSKNPKPDKGRNDGIIRVEGGYGYVNLVSDDIWIGVRAPQVPTGFNGIYNYELAASTDAPYVTYFNGDPKINDAQITAWDTDSNSSILWTGDITNSLSNSTYFSQWMAMEPPPFKVYVYDPADRNLQGISRSICGLRNYPKVQKSDNSMVKIGGQPKQLFYVNGLNRNSSYYATMTLEKVSSNATVGGGGAMWKSINFTTKSDNNCQIIYNLPFCTDVAYAVPSNPFLHPNPTELGLLYDTHANESYQNFSKSLQQIACDTTDSARYSLARNCEDCDNAYKAWLCAVTIPRCEDFSASSNDTRHLIPRNINATHFINGTVVPTKPKGDIFSVENKTKRHFAQSRNSLLIDEKIQPGPYKEMLPCKDLCYHLVQNCPAALKFALVLQLAG